MTYSLKLGRVKVINQPEVVEQALESYVRTKKEKEAIRHVLDAEGKIKIEPRKAKVFADLFGKDGWYAWQWTETGLRIPKGYKSSKHETDSQGRKYYPRIVLIGDHEIGEILVPEGNGRVVVEWDEVFGIPRITSDKEGDMLMENHTTHFYFDPNPRIDERTERQDVAVARWCDWLHGGHEGCLSVSARYGRWRAGSDAGFRQVRGSLPVIEKLVLGNKEGIEKDPQIEVVSQAEYKRVLGELSEAKKKLAGVREIAEK